MKSTVIKIFWGCFAAIAVLLFGLGVFLPAQARDLPLVGNVFSYLQDSLDIMGMYSAYAYQTGVIATSNDIDVTLSEVYCDGENLYVAYIVKSEKFSEMLCSGKYSRDQLIYSSKSYISYDSVKKELNETIGVAGLEGRFEDERTFAGAETYFFNDEAFPSDFKLNITLGSIGLIGSEGEFTVKGEWHFCVDVQSNLNDVATYEIYKENNKHTIDTVIISPIMVTVHTSYPDKYREGVNYRVAAYSDLFPKEDITKMGVYENKKGVTKIPRYRIGDALDIYVLDYATLSDRERIDERINVENHAIVSAHVDLQKMKGE